jgi:hypothetical protein
MISLNEGHQLRGVLENLLGWASQVFLVDSFSSDETINIALEYGIQVVQRPFRGFGDQWNFALTNLPVTEPWTMKLDPDERLSEELKASILDRMEAAEYDALNINLRLCFMGKELSITKTMLRVWRTGSCKFSNVMVNEHAIVTGRVGNTAGTLYHHDSPDLHHWMEKQNQYTTREAISTFEGRKLSVRPSIWGTKLQRTMWLKKNYQKIPGRYWILFWAHFLFLGAWKAGRVGWIWARLRTEVYRLWELKVYEMKLTGRLPLKPPPGLKRRDERVQQFE